MVNKQVIGMKGKVSLYLRRGTPRSNHLDKLSLLEIDSNTRLLSDDDREYYFMDVKDGGPVEQKLEMNNLIVTSGLDRIISLLGRGVGYQIGTAQDDRRGIANSAAWSYYGFIGPNTDQGEALFPELIILGRDNSPRTLGMTSLVDPLTSTYKNTYNTKTGGHRVAVETVTNNDYNGDYISLYACIYTSDEQKSPSGPYREVALMAPVIYFGTYTALDGVVSFSDAPWPAIDSPNRFWSPLNIVAGYDNAIGGYDIQSFNRNNITISRDGSSQSIDLNNSLIGAGGNFNKVIIAYTPRPDNASADPATTRGSTYNFNPLNPTAAVFSPASLISTVALPVPFIKNVNYSLSVTWQIYIYRGS